jgi:hypothetical protein
MSLNEHSSREKPVVASQGEYAMDRGGEMTTVTLPLPSALEAVQDVPGRGTVGDVPAFIDCAVCGATHPQGTVDDPRCFLVDVPMEPQTGFSSNEDVQEGSGLGTVDEAPAFIDCVVCDATHAQGTMDDPGCFHMDFPLEP